MAELERGRGQQALCSATSKPKQDMIISFLSRRCDDGDEASQELEIDNAQFSLSRGIVSKQAVQRSCLVPD